MRHRLPLGIMLIVPAVILAGCGGSGSTPAAPTSTRPPLAAAPASAATAAQSASENPNLILPAGVETVRTGAWSGAAVQTSFPARTTAGEVDIAFRCDQVTNVVVTVGSGEHRTEIPTTCGSGFSVVTQVPANTPLVVRATGKAAAHGAYAVSLTPVRR